MSFANSPHKKIIELQITLISKLSTSVHASNTSTWEAKAGGLKFKAILGYLVRPCAKLKKIYLKANVFLKSNCLKN